MFRVKVNATSANLCVGFDVLGLALDIQNVFTFEKSNDFEFYGFEEKYCNKEHNLVYDSYVKLFEKVNKKPIPVKIGFSGDIPVSRGLGSSSSLIVGGVFAANHILGNPLSINECFDICASIEGHPDNVAPAIYGGLVASYKIEDKYYPNLYKVSDKLKFITIIPPFELSTEMARGVLPHELPYKDIVNNLSRIVNIPRAFNDGDLELINNLFNDKLHEPYRGKLIKGFNEVKELCNSKNVALCISGSGSTMLAIAYDYEVLEDLKKFGYELRTPNIGSGVLIEEE
ncbi:MAG: homoserine kinase [Acholeplasmatales bacterium]|nr:homoserine kinase [Acholeplasmatales bacterium]